MQLKNMPALGLISVYVSGALVQRSSCKDAQRCFSRLLCRLSAVGTPCLLELTAGRSGSRKVLQSYAICGPFEAII